jgi:hypothetical protein
VADSTETALTAHRCTPAGTSARVTEEEPDAGDVRLSLDADQELVLLILCMGVCVCLRVSVWVRALVD